MKKSTKTILLVGTISLAAGIVISIIASVLGAGAVLDEMADSGSLRGIHIPYFSLGNVTVNWSDWDDFEGIVLGNSNKGEDIIVGDGGNVTELEISCGAAEVVLLESEDEKIHLVNNSNSRVKYGISGDTFTVKCKGKTSSTGEIDIYLPRDIALEELKIEIGAGVLESDVDLKTEDMSIDVGAGQVVMSKITADKAEFSIGAGQLTVKASSVGEMTSEIGMGEFIYNGAIKKSGDIEVAMGNAQLSLADGEEYYRCDVSIAAGNVDVGDRNFSAGVYDGSFGEGENELNLECAMGNITVTFDK